jgi:D-beta-D-heptose 7-phosphate kinase/D-beta-D-heptose 1-phosphate adenosyltransferase
VLGGIVGADDNAKILGRVLGEAGLHETALLVDPARPTTSKLRVLARGQQIARIDDESRQPLSAETANELGDWAERMLGDVDGVLLSDYGKGVLAGGLGRRLIDAARSARMPVVVDPKGKDVARYGGVTVLKPNLGELAELTGLPVETEAELVVAGRALAEQLPGSAVLVTRGPEGMALFRAGEWPLKVPAGRVHRVYDATGAGDTVAAALSLALAAGHPIPVAARLANVAASIVVCKVGTAAVNSAELIASLGDPLPGFEPVIC